MSWARCGRRTLGTLNILVSPGRNYCLRCECYAQMVCLILARVLNTHCQPTSCLPSSHPQKSARIRCSKSQQTVSRSKLPNKEELIRDTRTVLERHSVSTLLVIDLDNFKSVNDTKGHSEGDDCLDRVVKTIGNVIGRKGKIYRWGGDEFAIWLPDFSTEEAQVTAERIRCEVERAKPGGDIAVTASIG